jgi:hypothetical protein
LAATPEVDESYDIYGMRLVSMAELAFPADKKECASQLRQQFLNSIAPTIRSKLVDSERSLRAVTGRRQKHFPFSTLIEEAYELQQELPQLRTALYTSHQQSNLQPKSSSFQTQHRPVQSGEFRPQRLTPKARPLDRGHPRPNNQTPSSSQCFKSQPDNVQSSSQRQLFSQAQPRNFGTSDKCCHYCQNPNHLLKDCWKASKLCLICGKDHHLRQCSRYNPNYRPRSLSQPRSSNNPLN